MGPAVFVEQFAGPEADQAVEFEEDGCGSGDGLVGLLALRLDAEMCAEFGECDFDLPTTHEAGDDVGWLHGDIGTEERLRSAPPSRIADQHPAVEFGRGAPAIPQRGVGEDFEVLVSHPAVPLGDLNAAPVAARIDLAPIFRTVC